MNRKRVGAVSPFHPLSLIPTGYVALLPVLPGRPATLNRTQTRVTVIVVNAWPRAVRPALHGRVIIGDVHAASLPRDATESAAHTALTPRAPLGPLRI